MSARSSAGSPPPAHRRRLAPLQRLLLALTGRHRASRRPHLARIRAMLRHERTRTGRLARRHAHTLDSIGDIVHALRQPLMVIGLNAELLRAENPGTRHRHAVHAIDHAAHEIQALIAELSRCAEQEGEHRTDRAR
ncbi:MAG: hypothetical protein H6934_01700 [Burkholderiaceae bacterium]|nr:hypothetical protein [Burkholderiaceae bacterium]